MQSKCTVPFIINLASLTVDLAIAEKKQDKTKK